MAWLLARRDFWGKSFVDAADPSAAGAAAGRHRLSAAADIRPARPGRRLACRPSRHRVRVPLDRRGAGLRRDVVSAAGAADPAVDRSGGPRPRAGRRHAWRGALAGVSDRHLAAGAAGRAGRHGARLCQGDRRIRRDHYLRVEHSRRDPDHFVGDLFADPDPGRRCRGAAAGGGLHPHRDGARWSLPNGSRGAPMRACTGIDHAARRRLKTARRIRDRSLVRQRRPRHRAVRRLGRRQDLARST